MPHKDQQSTSRRSGGALANLRTAFDLLVRLQSGRNAGVTVDALSAEQSLSTKQVRRYLNALAEFRVGFETDESGNWASPLRITTVRRYQPPFNALFLTREELLLHYAQLAGLHNAGDPATRSRLREKVTRNLGVETINRDLLQSAIGGFDKAYKSYGRKRGIIAGLLSALYGNHPCHTSFR